MAETKTCPDCGAALPADAPQGFCPQCLLAAGAQTGAQTVAADDATRPADPSHASRLFGGQARITQHEITHFGDYELLEEIARGGMGVVYKTRQKSLNRLVAVKMILAGQFAGKQIAQRFKSEAGAAAVLQHPNIVAVHEVGVHEGQHFFSMDYVEGQNLAQLVGNRPLPAAKAARYVKLIAEAIHYAHGQGILHRDLKPSNVLIDAATDQPRVTDFGLAKRLDSESSLTVTGQVLGSPNFMPPEQASGSRGKVGRPSDVYGLGGILYYTLTARAPFQGATLETTIHEVLNTEPLSPRALNPSVPPDLETICLKCLEKEPARRYQTAQEVADELSRFLNDEPIRARPVSRIEHVWRWCRRKPALSSSLAAAAVLLLIVSIGSPIAAYRINQERQQKEQEAYGADMALAQQDLRDNNLGRALTLVQKYAGLKPGKADMRGWEWRYLWKLCQGDEKLTLGGHTDTVYCAVFSPDGRTLATAGEKREVKIWDVASRSLLATLTGFNNAIEERAVCFSPDGKFLAVKGGTRVIVWETHRWQQPLQQFEAEPNRLENMNDALVFCPDGQTLATRIKAGVGFRGIGSTNWQRILPKRSAGADDFGTNAVPSRDGWQRQRSDERIPDNFGRILEFSPDGRVLVVSDWYRLDVLEAESLQTITSLEREPEPRHLRRVLAVAFSPNLMAVGYRDGWVKLFATNSWEQLAALQAHPTFALGLAFSPDGATLATGGSDQVIKLWDVRTAMAKRGDFEALQPSSTLRGNNYGIRALSFSPDGHWLVSASTDGVKLWEIPIKRAQFTLPGGAHPLQFTSDGKRLFTESPDQQLQVLDLASQRVIARYGSFGESTNRAIPAARQTAPPPIPVRQSRSRVISSDGRWLALGLSNGVVELRNLEADRVERTFRLPEGDPVTYLAFSARGERLAASSESLGEAGWRSRVEVFHVLTGQSERAFPGCRGPMDFSPDGHKVAFFESGYVLQVFDLKRNKVFRRLAIPVSIPFSLAFSPNGELLAAGMGNQSIAVWEVASGRQRHLLKDDRGGVTAVAFSPDSRTVATRTWDNIVKLWHVATGREMLRFEDLKHGDYQQMAKFSPDGTWLALAGKMANDRSGAVELLRAPSFEEIVAAEKAKEQRK